MRSSFVPVIAAISLMALPAFAASSSSGMTASSTDSQNADATSAEQKTQDTGQIRQNIHQDLAQAGYTDIHIMPGSFLVHAKDKQGHPIEMMISPDSVMEVAAIPAASPNMKTSSNTNTPSSNGANAQSNK